MKAKLLGSILIIAMLVIAIVPAVGAAPSASSGVGDDPELVQKEDNLPDPLTLQQQDLKKQALEAKLNGKAYGKVKEVARGQYVELALEGTGMIWTVMGEFSDYPHNSILQPDRLVDNTTLWVPDFSKAYMDGLLYDRTPGVNSMANYYLEQSSGRYTVGGEATDWIPVDNHLKYDDNPDQNVWLFLNDTVDGWYAAQLAAGKTDEQINAYLSKFDVRDRYDYDGDGNFNEPDGYIDTFQSVHSGEGEEGGGGVLGAEAIWSHSWYAYYGGDGPDGFGPDFDQAGGLKIGNSNYWVGKYTVQPENGGIGVFTHEFGHDLGLPDLYDTSGGENGTGFWTLMSSGSWMGDGTQDIGSKSSHMGAWEKYQLGWLKYEVARAGVKSVHKLGPMEYNTKQAQGLFVILPKKSVVTNVGLPYAGANYYYSGAGDNLNSFMYKQFSLPAASSLSAKVKFDIELDWDYAYLVYSTDNGVTWTSLNTNLSTTTNPNSQNFGFGITGKSGGKWVDLSAPELPAGDVLLGFRYWTDANTGGFGFMIDDISINGAAPDGAETDAGWTYKPTSGFHVTTGTETALKNHYYVAEYRTYKGYDSTLKVGPYFFGYLNDPSLGNFVDHFPYQDGLLINYWDTSQVNNQTRKHPGMGRLLPIDAHFQTLYRVDGNPWRNRVQSYDSTFTLDRTDALPNLHVNSVLSPVPSLPAVKFFDDRTTYYDPANPQGSVINPNTGTRITIQSISALGGFMQVEVRPVR
ncbi:MAG TPA: immune inhibitor A domain-containing protein [Anaerolineales bacterium]|jgi:immune inhibitor A